MNKTIKKPYNFAYPLNPQTIGDQIRKARIERGLFQKDLASLFEVSEDSITNWENNKSVPQVHFYPRINSFLDFDHNNEEKRTIGDLIKAYRLKKGISQKKLGVKIGVNGSTISGWENGTFLPKGKLIKKLEKLFKG